VEGSSIKLIVYLLLSELLDFVRLKSNDHLKD